MGFDDVLGLLIHVEVLNSPFPCPSCMGKSVHVEELALDLVIVPVISEKVMQEGSLYKYLLIDPYFERMRQGICCMGDCVDVVVDRHVPMLDVILHLLDLVMRSYFISEFVKAMSVILA